MRTIAILLLLCSPALAHDPIVCVRTPWDGVTSHAWPSTINPLARHIVGTDVTDQFGGDVVLVKDGVDEVLVDSGPQGNVIDTHQDGDWAYYAKRLTAGGKYDLYKLNLTTRQEVCLTGPGQGNNIGPCPLGPQLSFNSDRDGFRNNGGKIGQIFQPCFLGFTMDKDGKNVERHDAYNLGSELHNEPYIWGNTVKLLHATGENMGGRSPLAWALRFVNRDGTSFEPVMSAYSLSSGQSAHFHSQRFGSSRVDFTDYYPARNGTGTIISVNPFPTGSPAPPPRFVSTSITSISNGFDDPHARRQPFFTAEAIGLTTFTYAMDSPPKQIGGVPQGFVTHPDSRSPAGMLLTWTGNEQPTLFVNGQSGFSGRGRIVLTPYAPIANSNQLVIVKDDPNYSYTQPRWVLPSPTLPTPAPWNPNDGTKCPALPKGTPFALIGSASTLNREWLPWDVGGGQIPAVVNDEDIHYVRLLLGRPSPAGDPKHFMGIANERLDILADISVRHPRTDSTSPLDGQGKPDTSWLALVPADTPILQAALNQHKEQIALSRTWKGFRPGEFRADCGGCHAHTVAGVPWETTLAYRHLAGNTLASDPPFEIWDATKARTIQRERDIDPILARHGLTAVVYNQPGPPPAGANVLPCQALKSLLYTSLPGTVPAADKAMLRDWIDSGAGSGPGITVDDLHPVLTIQEPNREQPTPITAIRFGAFDVHSGLGTKSVKASFAVSGRQAQAELADLFTEAANVWTLHIPSQPSGEVTVTVTDAAGNPESMTRTWDAGPPSLEKRIAQLEAQIAALEALRTADAATIAELRSQVAALKAKLANIHAESAP